MAYGLKPALSRASSGLFSAAGVADDLLLLASASLAAAAKAAAC